MGTRGVGPQASGLGLLTRAEPRLASLSSRQRSQLPRSQFASHVANLAAVAFSSLQPRRVVGLVELLLALVPLAMPLGVLGPPVTFPIWTGARAKIHSLPPDLVLVDVQQADQVQKPPSRTPQVQLDLSVTTAQTHQHPTLLVRPAQYQHLVRALSPHVLDLVKSFERDSVADSALPSERVARLLCQIHPRTLSMTDIETDRSGYPSRRYYYYYYLHRYHHPLRMSGGPEIARSPRAARETTEVIGRGPSSQPLVSGNLWRGVAVLG